MKTELPGFTINYRRKLPISVSPGYNTGECGFLPLSRIVLWEKGRNQCQLTTFLLSELPAINLGMVLMVRNLKGLDCPPAWQLTLLQPDLQPTTMAKLLAMSEWLLVICSAHFTIVEFAYFFHTMKGHLTCMM